MSKITSHFKQVVPYHPSKVDAPVAVVKTLRPPFECGDDWCLNGPPIEGATTYFVCAKCTRETTNAAGLAGVLRYENKRRPAPPKSEGVSSPPSFREAIDGFGFEYMAEYCTEHLNDLVPSSPTRKDFDGIARFMQYLVCLKKDCGDLAIRRQLEGAGVFLRAREALVQYERIFHETLQHSFWARQILNLYSFFAGILYDGLKIEPFNKEAYTKKKYSYYD